MGKESPLKLSQRGQDARAEVPMRTPKRLYAEARIIYHPELLTCLELEGHFREARRRLLRTTGQQGQTQRTLQRQGAWELLPLSRDRGQVT
jgi:hypothetical protein